MSHGAPRLARRFLVVSERRPEQQGAMSYPVENSSKPARMACVITSDLRHADMGIEILVKLNRIERDTRIKRSRPLIFGEVRRNTEFREVGRGGRGDRQDSFEYSDVM